MDTVRKIFNNESDIVMLIAIVMVLGISFGQFFGNTWTMISAVAIQLALLFLLGRQAGKKREESQGA